MNKPHMSPDETAGVIILVVMVVLALITALMVFIKRKRQGSQNPVHFDSISNTVDESSQRILRTNRDAPQRGSRLSVPQNSMLSTSEVTVNRQIYNVLTPPPSYDEPPSYHALTACD